MARYNFQIPVQIRGLYNGMVFKERHGDPYVARPPHCYSKLDDPKSVFNQNQFKFISELSTAANRVKLIKDIWMQEFPKCYGSYQEIYKSNFHNFMYSDLTGIPIFTPKKGFTLKNPIIEINENLISLKTEPLEYFSGTGNIHEKYLTSAALFIFHSTKSSDSGKIKIKCLNSNKTLFSPTNPVNFGINVNEIFYGVGFNFVITQIYFFLATLDENENPIRYSELISFFLPTPQVADLQESTGTSPA